MSNGVAGLATVAQPAAAASTPARRVMQRKCACGGSEHECEDCKKKKGALQRQAVSVGGPQVAPPIVLEVLKAPGEPLDHHTREFMEARFGHDFGMVRVHADTLAGHSADAVRALAYTVGRHLVFRPGQYAPQTAAGKLTSSAPAVQRRAAPYIKRVTVHLTPPQKANLEWEGTAPADAPGQDNFMVSTGKGYGEPDDPPGTCTRSCCKDSMQQCAPPWNRPDRVGACCTYYGDNFWTGTPLPEHNTWKWWTPIEPHYGSRGIALHQHTEVTGEPIGHGCVRMEEANAKRIYDFSNGRHTNVTIDGRGAPVACPDERKCSDTPGSSGARGEIEGAAADESLASAAIPGLEGVMS